MDLTPETLEKIRKRVADLFPETEDVEPDVETEVMSADTSVARKLGISLPHSRLEGVKVHTLVFGYEVKAEDGQMLTRLVRVSVDEKGEILRISSSR